MGRQFPLHEKNTTPPCGSDLKIVAVVIVITTLFSSKYALVAASHGYILGAHMNKHTLLSNVMVEKRDLAKTNIVKPNPGQGKVSSRYVCNYMVLSKHQRKVASSSPNCLCIS